MTTNPVDILAPFFGGKSKMAGELGVRPSAVSNWRSSGIPDAQKWAIYQKLRRSGLSDADFKRAMEALGPDVAEAAGGRSDSGPLEAAAV